MSEETEAKAARLVQELAEVYRNLPDDEKPVARKVMVKLFKDAFSVGYRPYMKAFRAQLYQELT